MSTTSPTPAELQAALTHACTTDAHITHAIKALKHARKRHREFRLFAMDQVAEASRHLEIVNARLSSEPADKPAANLTLRASSTVKKPASA